MSSLPSSEPAAANDLNGEQNKQPVARVVLPEHDEDSEPEAPHSDDEEGDFLEDFPDDTDELDLVHSRLGSLSGLRLERFKASLKRLCLRQNHIALLDPQIFHQLVLLVELDLYDNKLKNQGVGDALDKLENLNSLDLSFNLLKHVPDALEKLQALETVYFVQNRIHRISGLGSSVNLRSLELGGNKIRTIENLDALVNLEELWLGKNKITKLENLSNLKKLKILSIQSNRITKLEGLDELLNLEELYLSHNGVEKIEGLTNNVNLRTLDLGSNFVPQLENLSHLTNLEELWISGNKIPNFVSVDKELASLPNLETLYLEDNPCQTADRTGYRRKVILALPRLKQLDATYVRQT